MTIEAFFDARTSTLTYLVWDPATRDAVVIDPLLDFDPNRVRVTDDSLRRLEARLRDEGLHLRWILETHVHADHLTGAALLRRRTGAKIAVSHRITTVQARFGPLFGADLPTDGRPFDLLVHDGDVVRAGSLPFTALETPGHTPACVTWQLGDALFTGDALFMPDQGTGRCDFPDGSATQLYTSIQRLYQLPPATRVFVGHDYQPGGRPLQYETTIGAQREANLQLRADTDEGAFVAWRTARDATLALPNLLLQSLQVNLRAGEVPASGFLVLPLNAFDGPVPE